VVGDGCSDEDEDEDEGEYPHVPVPRCVHLQQKTVAAFDRSRDVQVFVGHKSHPIMATRRRRPYVPKPDTTPPKCKCGTHRPLDQIGDRVALGLCFGHERASTRAEKARKCPVRHTDSFVPIGSADLSVFETCADYPGSWKPGVELKHLLDALQVSKQQAAADAEEFRRNMTPTPTCEYGSYRQLHQKGDDLEAGLCFGHIHAATFVEKKIECPIRGDGSEWWVGLENR
jgi:hypothetical protein